MMEEARLAYVRLRESDISQSPETVARWMNNAYELFPEGLNDCVHWSYDHMDSPWHTAFTTNMTVEAVEIDGERVYENGKLTRIDISEIRAKALEQSQRLFERLAS